MWKVLFAAVAAASFGALFQARGRNLLLIGLNGGMGYWIYAISSTGGQQNFFGVFLASAAMAAFAEVAARWRKAPVSVFLAAALVPVVPGGAMFRCALNLLEGNTALAGAEGVEILLQAGAIAIGIIVISSLTKVLTRREGGKGESGLL